MLAKVCGLTNAADAALAAECGADYLGFVHHPPSPRHCQELTTAAKGLEARAVLVTVGRENVLKMTDGHLVGIRRIQPHLPPSQRSQVVASLRAHGFWVLLPWPDEPDQPQVEADLYLWEPSPRQTGVAGGSGQTHAMRYPPPGPFLLAGGLDASNLPERFAAIPKEARALLKGADAASRLERSPGLKDPNKVQDFVAELKKINSAISTNSGLKKGE